jgi:sugar lactone lactonase YvrE
MHLRGTLAALVLCVGLLACASGSAATSATSYPLTFALPTGATCTVHIAYDPSDPLGIGACAQQASTAQAGGTTIGIAPNERCGSTGNMSVFMGGYGEGHLANGGAPLWEPFYLIRDPAGNLYVSDSLDNRIRKVATSGVMTTYAGSGPAFLGGDEGDGQQATCARLNYPMGLARDGAGDVYFVDWFNDVVRKIDPSGVITTVAGNGVRGSSGNGGPATAASLASPFDVAVHDGSVYIADAGNAEVRKVAPDGTITAVAGTGNSGYSGDGGPATLAQLSVPVSVRFDSAGNLYIAEYGNCVVRKVDTAGIISTVAGTGKCGFSGDGGPATQAQLWGPNDISVDSAGDIYIADLVNFRIREVVASTHTIKTVAGTGFQNGFTRTGGAATSTDLLAALGVAADDKGGFYFTDPFDVFHVGTDGLVHKVAGDNLSYTGDGQSATVAELLQPLGVASGGNGTVYVADSSANRIRAVSLSSGIASTVAGRFYRGIFPAGFGGDGGAATAAFLAQPSAVARDSAGNLYIADTGNDVIRRVSSTGVITTVAGVRPTCTSGPFACVHHPGYSGDGGPATKAELNGPTGIAVDGHGNLYIADTNNQRIREVDTGGVITTIAGDGVAACVSFVCEATGDGGAATSATLAYPQSVAVRGKTIYIGDTADNVVRAVSSAGVISTIAGDGVPAYTGDGGQATRASLQSPGGIVLDGLGDLFIADTANAVVREVTPDGTIETVAGNGPQVYTGHPNYPEPEYFGTYCGDRGAATDLCLAKPTGVAVADSKLYIADANNARIWRVTLP